MRLPYGATYTQILALMKKQPSNIPTIPESLTEAVQLFSSTQSADWMPYLGILGPSGSGKSGYLYGLRATLTPMYAAKGNTVHLVLDLRQLGIDTEESMFAKVGALCLTELNRRTGSPLAFKPIQGRSLDAPLRELLRQTDFVIVYVDNAESVPRYLTRALLSKFRQFYEERDDVLEYRRLGLIISGALSIFDLKKDANSVVSLNGYVLLPFLDMRKRREQVVRRLSEFSLKVSDPILDILATETGGEPAFLDPLLERFRGIDIDTETIATVVEELASITSALPILQDIGLHIYGNTDLRDIIIRLAENVNYVRPGDPVVDIDRFHLMGAVILDRREPLCYKFRNTMVERYCRAILKLPYFQVGSPVDHGSKRREPRSLGNNNLEAHIEDLERIKFRVHASATIWDCLVVFKDFWRLLFRQYPRAIDLFIQSDEHTILSFNLGRHEIRERPIGESDEASIRAISRANAERRSSIGCDEHDVSHAVLLFECNTPTFLVTCLSRSDLDGVFSEIFALHWSRLVQEFGAGLENRAFAELGRSMAKTRPISPPAATDPGAALSDHLHLIRIISEHDVGEFLAKCRFALLIAILAGIIAAARFISPFVFSHFDLIEPAGFILSILISCIAIVLTILGYKRDPLDIQRYIWSPLSRKLVARRLRKVKHLLESDGSAGSG
jgi:hypothetical protein